MQFRLMLVRFLSCTAVLAHSGMAAALTFGQQTVICPIDGKSFDTKFMRSGTSASVQLDGKQWGSIVSPPPIPKCPENGFVIFKEHFTPTEITRLRAYVQSAVYQALQANETPHYLAARLASYNQEPEQEVANWHLRATWEAETGAQYSRYAAEALKRFEAIPKWPATPAVDLVNRELFMGELERRIGRFDAAKLRFTQLASSAILSKTQFRPIVDFQLMLLERRDTQAHDVPDLNPSRNLSSRTNRGLNQLYCTVLAQVLRERTTDEVSRESLLKEQLDRAAVASYLLKSSQPSFLKLNAGPGTYSSILEQFRKMSDNQLVLPEKSTPPPAANGCLGSLEILSIDRATVKAVQESTRPLRALFARVAPSTAAGPKSYLEILAEGEPVIEVQDCDRTTKGSFAVTAERPAAGIPQSIFQFDTDGVLTHSRPASGTVNKICQ